MTQFENTLNSKKSLFKTIKNLNSQTNDNFISENKQHELLGWLLSFNEIFS